MSDAAPGPVQVKKTEEELELLAMHLAGEAERQQLLTARESELIKAEAEVKVATPHRQPREGLSPDARSSIFACLLLSVPEIKLPLRFRPCTAKASDTKMEPGVHLFPSGSLFPRASCLSESFHLIGWLLAN